MFGELAQTWWLILISVASGVTGQTVLKMGVEQPGSAGIDRGLGGLITTIVTTPLVLLGLALYGVGALAWIVVLRRMDLSHAYPFLALNFVLIALVSRFVLGESLPPMRWLGIGVICAGILLVARSGGQ
jgi:multidrug transporter EmrE-like cation transporter